MAQSVVIGLLCSFAQTVAHILSCLLKMKYICALYSGMSDHECDNRMEYLCKQDIVVMGL